LRFIIGDFVLIAESIPFLKQVASKQIVSDNLVVKALDWLFDREKENLNYYAQRAIRNDNPARIIA